MPLTQFSSGPIISKAPALVSVVGLISAKYYLLGVS